MSSIPVVDLFFSQVNRLNDEVAQQEQDLAGQLESSGDSFPGSELPPGNRKLWMQELGPENVRVHQVVWPGSHNSATHEVGATMIFRPFAQCQTRSVYEQLAMGCRVLDVRVDRERHICHGPLRACSVEVVLADVKKFLSETTSEVVILEVRTEYNKQDPPGFADFLVGELGQYLIKQDDRVFDQTIAELAGRLICVWKPMDPPAPPKPGDLLWSHEYLRDDWIDTDLPKTKFNGNLKNLSDQPPVAERKFFYRVENTLTPQAGNLPVPVELVTRRIHRFAPFFISQVSAQNHGNKLQVFSTDFIDEDFVDACVAFTKARVARRPGT